MRDCVPASVTSADALLADVCSHDADREQRLRLALRTMLDRRNAVPCDASEPCVYVFYGRAGGKSTVTRLLRGMLKDDGDVQALTCVDMADLCAVLERDDPPRSRVYCCVDTTDTVLRALDDATLQRLCASLDQHGCSMLLHSHAADPQALVPASDSALRMRVTVLPFDEMFPCRASH